METLQAVDINVSKLYFKVLNNEQNLDECDATEHHSSNAAGHKKFHTLVLGRLILIDHLQHTYQFMFNSLQPAAALYLLHFAEPERFQQHWLQDF